MPRHPWRRRARQSGNHACCVLGAFVSQVRRGHARSSRGRQGARLDRRSMRSTAGRRRRRAPRGAAPHRVRSGARRAQGVALGRRPRSRRSRLARRQRTLWRTGTASRASSTTPGSRWTTTPRSEGFAARSMGARITTARSLVEGPRSQRRSTPCSRRSSSTAKDPAAYLHAAILAADRGSVLLPWQSSAAS